MTNLRFADDVLLVGSSLFQVRAMLSDLIIEAQKVGLSIMVLGKARASSRWKQMECMSKY